MKLIDEGGLYDRMQELLAMSTSVDIAMAWVRCGKPLDAILSFAKAHPGKLRVLCGVNGFLTEADALFQLHETGQLKIAYGTSGMKLHSKMFLFRDYTSTTAWVGSANLTDSAFSLNRELVCEFQDNGTGEKIFEAYWGEFGIPDAVWIEKYAELCGSLPSSSPTDRPTLEAPQGQQPISEDWLAYVAKLRSSKNQSRMKLIADHLPKATQIGLSNWLQLSKPDAEKLLGNATGYGGLGRLQSAGTVTNIFYESNGKNLKTREAIEKALSVIPIDPLAPAFEPMVKRAFDLVTNLDNVSFATVTRLLAVRNPDRFVSVNGESIAGLSKMSGITQKDLKTSSGYVALTRWVMKQPWWSTEDPQDDTSIYWRQRAAMLDILAYDGDVTKGMESDDDYLTDEE
jgi:hypothetical protein